MPPRSPEFGGYRPPEILPSVEAPPDVFAQWQRKATELMNPEKKHAPEQLGPDRPFPLIIDGKEVPAFERAQFDGQSFELQVYIPEIDTPIAEVRYRATGTALVMGKTFVTDAYQKLGINSRLFQDMSNLHPDCTSVETKLDETNGFTYRNAVQDGLDPISAIQLTPAAKIREKAGWVFDPKTSSLPAWDAERRRWHVPDKEHNDTTVRLTYHRAKP